MQATPPPPRNTWLPLYPPPYHTRGSSPYPAARGSSPYPGCHYPIPCSSLYPGPAWLSTALHKYQKCSQHSPAQNRASTEFYAGAGSGCAGLRRVSDCTVHWEFCAGPALALGYAGAGLRWCAGLRYAGTGQHSPAQPCVPGSPDRKQKNTPFRVPYSWHKTQLNLPQTIPSVLNFVEFSPAGISRMEFNG